MRVHHLYRFDDDDLPPLTASTFLEIHSYVVEQRPPDEDFSAYQGKSGFPAEVRDLLAFRGSRAISRIRAGAFTRTDMDAACAYLAVLLDRHRGKIAEIRAEGERQAQDPHTRRAYDGMLDAHESTHTRMTRLLADLNASYAGAMDAAELADGHP